jgi:hypothetical protein
VVLQASLPNKESGLLKPREDPKLLGTSKVSYVTKGITAGVNHYLGVELTRTFRWILQEVCN